MTTTTRVTLSPPTGWELRDVDDGVAAVESTPKDSVPASIVARCFPWPGALADLSFTLAHDLMTSVENALVVPLAVARTEWNGLPARRQSFVVESVERTLVIDRLLTVRAGEALEIALTSAPEARATAAAADLVGELVTWETPAEPLEENTIEPAAPRDAAGSRGHGDDLEGIHVLHSMVPWMPGGVAVHAPAASYLRGLNPAKPGAVPEQLREELHRRGALTDEGEPTDAILELVATLESSDHVARGVLRGRERESILEVAAGVDFFAVAHGPTARQIQGAPDAVDAESTRFLMLSPSHLVLGLLDWIGAGPTWAEAGFFDDVDDVALARRLQSAAEPVPSIAGAFVRAAWEAEWVRWSLGFASPGAPTIAGVSIAGVGAFLLEGDSLMPLSGRDAWDLLLGPVSHLIAAGHTPTS